ncbi:hypothetical protein EMIT0215P_100091 [Pseudomonas serboccidentalis]
MSVRHPRFSAGGWQAPSLKFYLHYRFTRTISGPIPDIAQEFRKKPVPPRATKKVGHREPGNQKIPVRSVDRYPRDWPYRPSGLRRSIGHR